MREETAKSSFDAAVFSEYGAVTRKVAEHLLRHGYSSLSQVVCATRLSHMNVSAAISLLLHIRCATYTKTRNKIFYSATKHEKRLFFATYCDFVAKCTSKSHGDVFRKILIAGITNTKRIRDAESLEFLVAKRFVSVETREEVQSNVLERNPSYRADLCAKDTEAAAKRAKLDGDEEMYAYVNYAEVERRIFDSCFYRYLEVRYDEAMASLFLKIRQRMRVSASDLLQSAETSNGYLDVYSEYLVSDGVVHTLPMGELCLATEWRDALKRDVLSRFLERTEGRALRRIFNTILKRGTVPDRDIARAAMVGTAETRCLMLRLQQTGCVGVFANFAPNAFYSKTNLSWRIDWCRSVDFVRTQLLRVLFEHVRSGVHADVPEGCDTCTCALDCIVLGVGDRSQ
eukprot:jgi/Antlo1/767/597